MSELNTVVIIAGGNLGDRMGYLIEAEKYIEKSIGHIGKKSRVYESESWGFVSDLSFLNQVFVLSTSLQPEPLLDVLLDIEKKLGRQRKIDSLYQSRTMDLDILFYNDNSFSSDRLVIPHPRIEMRNFVLQPLVEILPNHIHPKSGLSILELFNQCDDSSLVKIYEESN
ncbi:MAG: 2-amino-4-hydroxy-6-hydroxymethyldihydropteridine diphosphokinase [Bacteroidales bacterium]|nr:2-amino-4-hydroxy-6-hydroxymethyldihydropteridine diphosphokinase [Bacteroidales bacterium]